jgi:hypothetical protein
MSSGFDQSSLDDEAPSAMTQKEQWLLLLILTKYQPDHYYLTFKKQYLTLSFINDLIEEVNSEAVDRSPLGRLSM